MCAHGLVLRNRAKPRATDKKEDNSVRKLPMTTINDPGKLPVELQSETGEFQCSDIAQDRV